MFNFYLQTLKFLKIYRSYPNLGLSGSGSSRTFNFDHSNGVFNKHNTSSNHFGEGHLFGSGSTHLGSHHLSPDPFEDVELPKGTFHLDDYRKKQFLSNPSFGDSNQAPGSSYHNTFFSDFKNEISKLPSET